MHITGINGRSGPILGLLDTGADSTALPIGFASLMGYSAASLTSMIVGTAGSPVNAFRATQDSTANVIGIQGMPIALRPVFTPGTSASVLWGRSDLMSHFDIMFSERRQTFELAWN